MKPTIIKSIFLSTLLFIFCGVFFYDHLMLAGNKYLHHDTNPVTITIKTAKENTTPVIQESAEHGYIEKVTEQLDSRQNRIPLPRGN